MAHDVFISYAEEDKTAAHIVRNSRIERAFLRPFFSGASHQSRSASACSGGNVVRIL